MRPHSRSTRSTRLVPSLSSAAAPDSAAAPFRRAALLLATSLVFAATTASAYDIFPFGTNQALKWGASNEIGTPGGTVTWSLVADGTPFDPLIAGFNWSGTSDLASVYAQVGGQAAALAALQAAFDAWSQASGIQFVQVTESGGTLPIGAASAGAVVVGQIRVSAFAFAPGDFTAAVGFAAPPNGGTTLEGDLVFNVSNRFGLPVGNEGQLFDLFPPPTFFYLNDFAGLAAHEIGHSLGLAHSDVPTSLMCGFVSNAFTGSLCHWADPDADGRAPITRRPRQDDVAGILHLYGVPEPSAAATAAAGAVLVAAIGRRRRSDEKNAHSALHTARALVYDWTGSSASVEVVLEPIHAFRCSQGSQDERGPHLRASTRRAHSRPGDALFAGRLRHG